MVELARESITDILVSGILESSIQLSIDLDALGGVRPEDLVATIDGGNEAASDVYDECDETNNEDSWGEALCP